MWFLHNFEILGAVKFKSPYVFFKRSLVPNYWDVAMSVAQLSNGVYRD